MARDFWFGEPITAFVGRGGGRAHCFFSASRAECRGGTKFPKSESLELPKGLHGASFFGQSQVLCVGNETSSQVRTSVGFAPRAQDLTKHLSVTLEAIDAAKGSWSKVASLRISQSMAFEAAFSPNDWRAFRVSTI